MENKINKLRIWHISDTHTYHGFLKEPEDIDIAIFSGDCSNPRTPIINEPEVLNFLEWFSKLNASVKIMIAGNHDSSIESRLVTEKIINSYGIDYLENEEIIVNGLKIWGSPFTPTFGSWSFMRARDKLDKLWKTIPEDTDIVVVHGPPKGILDYSHDYDNYVENCGCSALMKRMLVLKPKLMCFGHIHNNKNIMNAGTMKLSIQDTIFSNGSVVTDGKFGHIDTMSNGNILTI
ncbi:MAG: metallophosphoesterase family protein [Chitinophagaceae bacterium]